MAKTKANTYNAEEEASRKDIREKIQTMCDHYSGTYEHILDQLKYAAGDQWDDKITNARTEQGMPTITLPLIQTYINRVVNDLRRNPIGMRVNHDEEVISDTLSGLLRQIETSSRATEIYEKAHDHQVSGGLGWIRIGLDYDHDETTDLAVKLYKVADPGSCWIDPYHTLPDGSDAEYGAYVSYISKSEAEAYGDDYAEASCDISFYNSDLFEVPKDSVAQIIFYEIVHTMTDRYFNADGTYSDDENPDAVTSRKVKTKQCKVTKIVGQKIVDETVVPVPYILLVPVKGNELPLEDKRLVGMTYWAKSSQDMVNLYTSTELQLVANAPKNPIIMAEGQDEGHSEWDDFNTKNYARLRYKPTTYDDGTPVAAPTRMSNAAETQFAISGRMSSVEQLGRTLGIFDSMLGEMQGAAESGSAIDSRTTQGQIGVLQYIQNLEHSVEQVCRVVTHLIPHVYDTMREITLYEESGEKTKIKVNLSEVITKKVINDVGFEMTSGPMIRNNEEENVKNIMRIAQLMPDKVPMMADLISEQMGGQVSNVLTSRLKKLLPPELQSEDGGEMDPKAQELLQQADAQVAELNDKNLYLEGIVKQLQADKIADTEKNRTDIVQTVIKEEGAMARERMKQDGLDTRQQEDIEAQASQDMLKLAEDYISPVDVSVDATMAPGSDQFSSQVRGPVAMPDETPEEILFEDENEPEYIEFG
jgi:hypothetical protein